MGLDMYLHGEKFYWTDRENPQNNLREDGLRVREKTLDLGYWRKHPDLHGYIVNSLADGVDECQQIDMTEEDIAATIEAIKAGHLPKTEGFFFGASTNDPDQQEEAVAIFTQALKWLVTKENLVSRSVYYRASW